MSRHTEDSVERTLYQAANKPVPAGVAVCCDRSVLCAVLIRYFRQLFYCASLIDEEKALQRGLRDSYYVFSGRPVYT